LAIHVFPENKVGLSKIYNSAIERFSNESRILVFAHDDLLITDFYWMHSVFNGLQHSGVVGCAGNVSRVPLQPSWAFKNLDFEWDLPQNLSGIVGHSKQFPPEGLGVFGPPFRQVKLLDGLFLAAFSETLKNQIFILTNDLIFISKMWIFVVRLSCSESAWAQSRYHWCMKVAGDTGLNPGSRLIKNILKTGALNVTNTHS